MVVIGSSTLLITLLVLLKVRSRREIALRPDLLSEQVEAYGHWDENSRNASKQRHAPIDTNAWKRSC